VSTGIFEQGIFLLPPRGGGSSPSLSLLFFFAAWSIERRLAGPARRCASDDYSMVIAARLVRSKRGHAGASFTQTKGPSLIRCIADDTSAALG
jgi:hypothetical protein